ncbi:sulfotransferase family protein [Litchfieldella anticariensis]|uniref:sulfotransferase family protein n=1 Tax=Litchfieldella anticariensis TaxID=258591 RepID=UPI0013775F05|nr:sulfotransferase [Halomonas anticariensis]
MKRRIKSEMIKFNHRRDLKSLEEITSFQTVFILGTQKSGTTAIAALLSKATKMPATLDLLDSVEDSSWPLRISYGCQSFSSFAVKHKNDFSRPIVKEPWLTYFYDDLVKLFPDSKYIMVMRHPLDTIRSVLSRLRIPGNLESINYDDYRVLNDRKIWRLALNSSWNGRLSRNYIEALAHRWDVSAKLYLNNKECFRLVRYEDFLLDKKHVIDILAQDMGLSVKYDISGDVDIQYQRKGNNEISFIDFFGEKNYEAIKNICEDSAVKFDYDFQLNPHCLK